MKRVLVGSLLALVALFLAVPAVEAARQGVTGVTLNSTYDIATDSNFFGEVENTTPVDIPADPEGTLATKGYVEIASDGDLSLYLRERYFQIAVLDRRTGYVWWSVYPDYLQLGYSGTSRFFIESGVVIEYYNLDNIQQEDSKSYLSGAKYNVEATYDYDAVGNGVRAHLDFTDLAIQFDVIVKLEDGRLVVSLPIDSLIEEDIEEPFLNLDGTTGVKIVQNRLKAVYLFPYFGSNNYLINGYALIPDGSGALIRYTDNRSSTAYVKRLYGVDEGIGQSSTSSDTWYLREEMTASAPVFGINHGYHQAAFLAAVTSGSGTTELHSYPYGYNTYTINTTFFKFIVRERFTIQTSSNASDSFQLINTDPYPTDFTVEYTFLAGDDADYAGMAASYRTQLGITADGAAASASTMIEAIGLDYKRGLFGKDYVAMTTYAQLMTILSELDDIGVSDVETVYLGWNSGGFYNNAGALPRASTLLGGSSGLADLVAYAAARGIEIHAYDDPLIAWSAALGEGVVKKITLSNFATSAVTTSLFSSVWFRSPTTIADGILDDADRYANLGISAFAFDTVGSNLFSWREGGTDHRREEAIATIREELALLAAYDLGLFSPDAYTWDLIDSYYATPIESNKYAYETDSVPFIPLVLHGAVDLYSTYANYVSDIDIFSLRLIEYGIMPSILLTYEPTHKLRHTNSAYVYTSEYDLWKQTIAKMHETVSTPLADVAGVFMTGHRYIADGVAETTYANGVRIYVNYNDDVYYGSGFLVAAKSAEVVSP
jgi:hypothetical protein